MTSDGVCRRGAGVSCGRRAGGCVAGGDDRGATTNRDVPDAVGGGDRRRGVIPLGELSAPKLPLFVKPRFGRTSW
jgi:hypothetical protein